jgi:alkanesulfonate monooxygenase SsuD/methylene tetrahydromethanopterin reductase-like flavin-dependent oxidoreductase (luciferase family)
LLYLQAAPFDDVLERVRRGEDMGFDSLWVADHMTGQYPNLVSFAPITFRHPALLAMAATTVDHASGGRLEIGLGIGGAPVDGTVVGADDWPGVERVARLEEQLDLLDRLLRGETIEAHAGYYPTAGAVIERSLQEPRPPFVVAGEGPRLLDLAARKGDAWNTLDGQPMRGGGAPPVSLNEAVEATRARAALLDEACDRIGRSRSSVRRTLLAYRVELFLSADAFSDYVDTGRALLRSLRFRDQPREESNRTSGKGHHVGVVEGRDAA